MRLGVSPRRLQGWEPREFTRYVRDGEGRVLESVRVREPEFDAEQVALLLAHLRAESEPRGSHGLPLSEATDPELNPASRGGARVEVVGPSVDFAAQALAAAQKQYYDKWPNAPREAHLWKVRVVRPEESPAAE